MRLLAYFIASLLVGGGCAYALAHQMTPTYLEIEPSFIDDLSKTRIQLLNFRDDVEYYELELFDADWNEIPFVSNKTNIVRVKHLGRVETTVYLRSEDSRRATYLCSTSRIKSTSPRPTLVSSKICSKFKGK